MLQDTTDRNTSIPMSAHDRSSPFGGLFFRCPVLKKVYKKE